MRYSDAVTDARPTKPRFGLLIGGLLAITAVSLGGYLLLRLPDGFLLGLHPVGAERSVFLMRYNGDDETRAWVGLVDDDEGLVWHQELPALTYSIYGRHGLTVSGDQVTVKVSDQETHDQVLAFGLADGEPRWTSDKLPYRPGEDGTINMAQGMLGERPYVDDTLLLYAHGDRDKHHLVARNPKTGATLWTHTFGDVIVRGLHITAAHVLYRSSATWTILDRATGDARTFRLYSDICVEGGTAWGLERGVLKRIALATGDVEQVPSPKIVEAGIASTCGFYGGHLVFSTTQGDISEGEQLIAMNRETGQAAWQLSLKPWRFKSIGQGRDIEGAASHPLRGVLPRFVTLLQSRHKGDGHRVAVIDLQDRRVVWATKPLEELLHHSVLRGPGGVHYVTRSGHVMAVDGTTGKVLAAKLSQHLENVRGFHAMPGALWVYSTKWSSMGQLPWAQLDSRTLAVKASGSSEVLAFEDALDKTRDHFAIPEAWVTK